MGCQHQATAGGGLSLALNLLPTLLTSLGLCFPVYKMGMIAVPLSPRVIVKTNEINLEKAHLCCVSFNYLINGSVSPVRPAPSNFPRKAGNPDFGI